MKVETLAAVYADQLKDLYSAENQLLKALPKLAKKAAGPKLSKAFESHLKETKQQVARLEKIGKAMDLKLTGKKCKAMAGLIEEGKEAMETEGEEILVDAMLIAAAQRVEHYEISSYGTARCLAEQLGESEAATLLGQTLDEESAADEKLNQIALEEIYPLAQDEETVSPASNGRGGSRRRAMASR